MHGDVSAGVMQKLDFTPVAYAGRGDDETTQTDPTGQAIKENVSPIGDAVLPLLMIACVYVVVRIFKNLKIKRSANETTID
jgi:hypothetical protein